VSLTRNSEPFFLSSLHPHICTVYEIGEDQERPFIAMEYLDGATLKHMISGRALPVEQALELGIQISDTLDAVYRAQLFFENSNFRPFC
jgi:serine/threonine protein kinase